MMHSRALPEDERSPGAHFSQRYRFGIGSEAGRKNARSARECIIGLVVRQLATR
jgi:hypothetical protein